MRGLGSDGVEGVGAAGSLRAGLGPDPRFRVGVVAPGLEVGVAELGRWGVVLRRCVEKELGVVGRERGTPEPNATVGVVARGVAGATRRLSTAPVGVRRPDDETDDRGVLDWPDKLPVDP